MLAEILPGPDGRLRDELRKGIVPPTPEEVKSWDDLPDADKLFAHMGATPIHSESGEDYYAQNGAEASIDINGLLGGDAIQQRTIIPATAQAKFTMRLAPDQSAAEMSATLEQLLREAAPRAAEVEISMHGTDPAAFDPGLPPLALAIESLEEVCGVPPALIRSGGSIPVLAAFKERDIPVILSGFTLPDDAFHAPDESFRLESLRLCEETARALYKNLARLPQP